MTDICSQMYHFPFHTPYVHKYFKSFCFSRLYMCYLMDISSKWKGPKVVHCSGPQAWVSQIASVIACSSWQGPSRWSSTPHPNPRARIVPISCLKEEIDWGRDLPNLISGSQNIWNTQIIFSEAILQQKSHTRKENDIGMCWKSPRAG